MRLQSFTFLIPLALVSVGASQQTPPATEVYVMALPLEMSERSKPLTWINISNSPGYDNQPSFLPDSSAILFSSNRDGKQTDIYRYEIATKSTRQLTNTVHSEYSPTVTPDGKTFSVIRQAAADGTQLLVRYDLATGAHHSVVFENVKPVGYHAWIDPTHVALFILGSGQGQPATLQIGDTKTGTAEVAATGIGRSVLVRPGAGTVSYITTGANRMVREYDPVKKESRDLFAPLEGSQDAVWGVKGGALWMANGTQISAHIASPALDARWQPLFNLTVPSADPSAPRIAGITRMSISPNGRWMAFVAEPIAK
jgi:dipeptidyl aminopeptidase/acylaminoacyl peptidase